jgi:hypothetical protein
MSNVDDFETSALSDIQGNKQKPPKDKPKPNEFMINYLTPRQRFEMLRQQMKNERSTFWPTWDDLARNVQPRRRRFFVQDTNKGYLRNHHIIDSTPTLSLRTMKSGMMGGITSPARPWFRLDTPDPTLAENAAVKEWLYEVTERMLTVFLKSNLYNQLPILYGDLGLFATAAMLMEEDEDEVVRFYTYPLGSYCIATDEKGRVNTWMRELEMTVSQLVDKFGKKDPITKELDWENFNWENFSVIVQTQIKTNQWNTKIYVVHMIVPNDHFKIGAPGHMGKRYISAYYEQGATSVDSQMYNGPDANRFLRYSGYDRFPILAPRWETVAEDAYGTDCPGITAIGDIKALQVMQKRKAQAIEKMVNPPMTGPASLRNTKTSLLPGDITYQDVREGQLGFRPVHEVKFDIAALLQDIEAHQQRIEKAFFVDLFMMMINDDRTQPATATEINEKKQEQMLAVGPVLEQLNQDVLDPMIVGTFALMLKQGKLPEPPIALHGIPLKVEYTSIMAEAQKLLGLSSTERFFQFVEGVVQIFPQAVDAIDIDEAIYDYGDKCSIAPKIVRDPKATAQIRQFKQKIQMQQLQSQQQLQQSLATKHLAQSPTDGPNALTELQNQAQAGNPVPNQ